jgi:hypothetical protein
MQLCQTSTQDSLRPRITRWETDRRYYEAVVEFDLFGDCVLTQRWGGLCSNRGGQKTIAVGRDLVMVSLPKIHKRRLQRGYSLVGGEQCPAKLRGQKRQNPPQLVAEVGLF